MISELIKKMNSRKMFPVLALGSFFFIWFSGQNLVWGAEKGYPNRPITIIVPNPPGGLNDLGTRIFADYLNRELEVPIIIENRGGAAGMLGTSMLLKAKPDGYTLVAAGVSAMITGPLQSPNPPYDPFKDFLPIGMFGVVPSALGVYNTSSFETIADVVKEAKKNPGKLSSGFTQPGSSTHMALKLFGKFAEVNIKFVPYNSPGSAISALLGKHIDMLSLTYVGFLPYTKSGEARVLAVTDSVPDSSVPTFAQAGYSQPELHTCSSYLSFYVSVNTPKPIHEKLVLSFERAAKNPELAKKWDNIGLIRNYKNPTEFAKYTSETWRVTSEVLEELGMKELQEKKN